MKKRLCGVAMALCVLLTLIPPGAFAADSDAYAILYMDGVMAFQIGDTPKRAEKVRNTYPVDLTAAYADESSVPWLNEREWIGLVTFEDRISPASTAHWFEACENLQRIENIGNLDTSNVTDMSWMFSRCHKLTALDVSGFDTSNVTDMSYMFSSCGAMFGNPGSLTELDVSRFNTSKVTNMHSMFDNCTNLTALDVSGFDTSRVTDMESMFQWCGNLTTLDVSSFDTSSVTNMNFMFGSCQSLTALDLSGFDTSNVTEMMYMFATCENLTVLDISGFDTSNATITEYMFAWSPKLKTIYASDKLTIANVPYSGHMFYGCTSLVGGRGTQCNGGEYSDYARIDYAPLFPGYFTEKTGPVFFTVMFNANGGTVSTLKKTVIQGEPYGDLPKPDHDEWKFDGWYDAVEGGTKITAETVVSLSENQELFAHWAQNRTVTFNANGGSVSQSGKTVTNGEPYGKLPTPTRPGYAFGGWFDATDGGTQVTEDTTVSLSENQELFARWTPNSYTVAFNANGGSVSPSNKEVTNGGTYGALPAPTRPGYAFDGWYDAIDGGKQVTPETAVSLSANQELFARWTPLRYTVAFNANGGSVSPDSKEVTNGGTYGALPTPTRTDYEFDGWRTAIDGGTQVTSETTVNLSANQELFARWTLVRAVVTFDANGGSVSPSSKEVINGGTYGELPAPVRNGYVFDGWYTAVEGGTQVTAVNAVRLSDHQTLYAHWRKDAITYSVADANGEASAVTDISQVAPGSELTVNVEREAPSDEFRTASVFCAVYDREGMMVHLQVWDMDVSDPLNIAMSGNIRIPENVSVGEIRVFVLSENLVPLRAAGILG